MNNFTDKTEFIEWQKELMRKHALHNAAPALLEACKVASKTILKICHDRKPEANNGLGLATPEEQVALEEIRAAISAAEGTNHRHFADLPIIGGEK